MQQGQITRDETKEIISAIENGSSVVHLRGEPFVVKEDVLKGIGLCRPRWRIRDIPIREGWSLERLIQKLIIQVGREFGVLEKMKERISTLTFSVAGTGSSIELQDQSDLLIEQLRTKVKRYKAETPLVITIKQLEVLDEEPSLIEAKLTELADILPAEVNVYFLTVGGYQFDTLDTVIEVTPFNEQESIHFLRDHFPELSTTDAQEIHNQVNGYPLYLQLIAQTHDTVKDLDLNKISDDVFDHIEAYERTFGDEQRQFLRRISALTELDERTCALITEFSSMEVGDILHKLNERLVLRELGRRDGLPRYTMRDPFQRYFHEHEPDTTAIHRKLFQHYAHQVVDALNEEEEWLTESFAPTSLCTLHLAAAYDGELTTEAVQNEIDKLGLSPKNRLQFAIGSVPQIASQVEAVEGLQYKEIDTVREQLAEQEDTTVEQFVTIDYIRAFTRLMVQAQTDDERESNKLIENATDIAEQALENIIGDKYDFQGEVPDNIEIGNLEIFGYLLAAYGHQKQGNEREKQLYLDKPLTILKNAGIPKLTAIAVFKRGQVLWKKLELQEELGEALSSNFDKVVDTAQENESIKETLLETQGNISDAFGKALIEALQKLYEHPYEVQEFIEDVGQRLTEDQAVVDLEEDHVISCGALWYQLAIGFQLYNPLKYAKYRRIHRILRKQR